MSFSIQTNVNSLVAQQNLSVNSAFQSRTIQRLTSGYRINSSGDDAAGLAVANKFRDATAELTQGVANGNDAVASLQIMDGGINNIGKMLDRLKTLAMQSASASFTGNRSQLNSEFQTDIAEIDRQAQSIGLNAGGTFAKSLSIYLGAGTGSQNVSNSVVNVDLSKSTVDTQSLGLSGYTAVNAAVNGDTTNLPNNYDLSDANGATNVGAIITTNAGSTTSAQFTFRGAGFGDTTGTSGGVAITLDTTAAGYNNIKTTSDLVGALNNLIQKAETTNTGTNYEAFRKAGITATIHTDANGKQQLAFTSNNTAFQVIGGDELANGLLGNWTAAADGTGKAAAAAGTDLVAQGVFELGSTGATGTSGIAPNTASSIAMAAALSGKQDVTISATDGAGVAHKITVNFNSGGAGNLVGNTVAKYVDGINDALQGSNDDFLKQITAVESADSAAAVGNVNFMSTLRNFTVTVSAPGTSGGLAQTAAKSAIQVGSGGTADISTIDGAQAAVTAISNAVNALGTAQAAIGKGQNQLNYAISLAQSQITNFSSAEAQIRDTDVASEAANLTKAQVLQQASIAAMAQANSAPQAVLALLRG